MRCPVCKSEVPPRSQNRFFPFCSERCKLVDLGRWFTEGYRVPGAAPQNGDDDGDGDEK